MTWKPLPRAGADPASLALDAEHRSLLAQVDGSRDVLTLAVRMGLGEDRIQRMLQVLVALGHVEAPPPLPAAPSETPEETAESPDDEFEAEDTDAPGRAATHRQLFETRLHHRATDERVALARGAEDPELSAYCFDPAAEVIRAVLDNPRTGGIQARLIAAHHRTSAGLEALGARTAFAHDGGVRRALLQNPLLPASLYRRLWSTRRLREQFLVVISRDAPEQIRAMARDQLRASFSQRTGEERAELILTTEGRCLAVLVGLTIDGHTTALLCRRTYVSTLLIQNIARWSAAPPQLIAHLRRQDVVKRNPTLRQMLERHPNAG